MRQHGSSIDCTCLIRVLERHCPGHNAIHTRSLRIYAPSVTVLSVCSVYQATMNAVYGNGVPLGFHGCASTWTSLMHHNSTTTTTKIPSQTSSQNLGTTESRIPRKETKRKYYTSTGVHYEKAAGEGLSWWVTQDWQPLLTVAPLTPLSQGP